MVRFSMAVLLALVSGVSAQDNGKDDCCKDKQDKECCLDSHALFCGNEKCDSEPCKIACEKAGQTLKAVGHKLMAMAKKEWGDKCADCCEKSDQKPCPECVEFCKTVVVPMIKERMTARHKDPSKEFKHTVKGDAGKTSEVACTFLSGDTCAPCVQEIADASFPKLKEMKAAADKKQP